jgi:hypothetical protein
MIASEGPLDTATIRDGFMRSIRAWDFNSLARLLTRYIAQPLSDSEKAWAFMNLANAFAVGERAAEAVALHETFEAWLPGKLPRLSSRFPNGFSARCFPAMKAG